MPGAKSLMEAGQNLADRFGAFAARNDRSIIRFSI